VAVPLASSRTVTPPPAPKLTATQVPGRGGKLPPTATGSELAPAAPGVAGMVSTKMIPPAWAETSPPDSAPALPLATPAAGTLRASLDPCTTTRRPASGVGSMAGQSMGTSAWHQTRLPLAGAVQARVPPAITSAGLPVLEAALPGRAGAAGSQSLELELGRAPAAGAPA